MMKEIKAIDCPIIRIDAADIKNVAQALKGVFSDGVWWKQIRRWFWWPVDFTGTVEIGRKPPTMKYWGYQHVADPSRMNSNIRYMLVENLQNYGSHVLKSADRNEIRAGLTKLEIRKIQEFKEEEAEQAMHSWNDLIERTRWRKKMDKGKFSNYWKELLSFRGHTVIGAFYEGKLVGWLVGIIIENGNCYITRYASLKDYFKLKVNNALIYAFLMSAKKYGVLTVNFGLFIPSRPGLDKFKENLGFKLTSLPAYTHIHMIIRPLILIPYKQEIDRLTGWYTDLR